MTSDTAEAIRFGAQRRMTRRFFESQKILSPNQFDLVDWPNVYRTLTEEVPKLFQLWACTQVHDIAGTNKELAKQDKDKEDKMSPMCPCCTIKVESA